MIILLRKTSQRKTNSLCVCVFLTSSVESRFKYMFERNEIEGWLWGGELQRMEEREYGIQVTKAEVETVWGRKRTSKERKEINSGKKKDRILGAEVESSVFPWAAWKQRELNYFSLRAHAQADHGLWKIRGGGSLGSTHEDNGMLTWSEGERTPSLLTLRILTVLSHIWFDSKRI